MNDPASTGSAPAPPGGDSARVTRWPLIAAALLVVAGVAVLYFVSRPPRPDSAAESEPLRALPGETLLEGAEARFTWSADPLADVYRIEAYDPAARLLAAAVLRDTSVLASALLPDSAHAGVWRVVPVSKGGTELKATPRARFVRP